MSPLLERIVRAKYVCHICGFIGNLLDNPHQYSGQVVAKLCVNLATMIWAAVVLFKRDALATWPASFAPRGTANEDVLAVILFVITGIAVYRLVRKDPPLGIGVCVYAALLALWLYTWTTLVIAVANNMTAARPGQLAGVTVVLLLAIFSFVSNPKRIKRGSPSH